MVRQWWLIVVVALMGAPLWARAQPVDLEPFLALENFSDARLSPDGEHVAVTVPLEGRTGMAVIRLADNKLVGSLNPPKNDHVMAFSWANNERVLISLGIKTGRLEEPQPTGELYSFNLKSGSGELLVGYRVQAMSTGSRIQRKEQEPVAAFPVDSLAVDSNQVLIRVFGFGEEAISRAERMDVRTGIRTTLMRAPVRRAMFLADPAGNIRFAWGANSDNSLQLHYRSPDGDGWRLLNDQKADGRTMTPLGLDQAGAVAYLQVSQPSGPDAVLAWDIAADKWQQVARHGHGDPTNVIYQPGTRIPVGIHVDLPKPATLFFDEQSFTARQYRNLEKAFPGAVRVINSTADGRKLLVYTWDDRNPGEYFVVDTVNNSAQLLFAKAERIDPERMAPTRVVELSARDGHALQGYLTLPAGLEGAPAPMVVLPHGGPFGIYDGWGYQAERQLLAAAGYAVLQVNYRGSGGAGRAHMQAGVRQWGLAMQDDLADATDWAVKQGIADAGRICIYGASYGGYAALMGTVRDPALYRCAAGYVGVYDLEVMQAESARAARWAGNWSREWVGDDPVALRAVSPTRLAGQIKVPVFLAAGGEDQVAPVRHTEAMEAALRKAGVPVSSLYYRNEGHGFYLKENQRAYYRQLLAFLSSHLGGAQAAP